MTSELQMIAAHEAGHVVVAYLLGFQLLRVAPTPDGAETVVLGPDNPCAVAHFALAVQALAGGYAQGAAGYKPDSGCMTDVNNAAKHIHQWLGATPYDPPPTDPTERAAIDTGLQRAHDVAEGLCITFCDEVDRVAAYLVANQLHADGPALETLLSQ